MEVLGLPPSTIVGTTLEINTATVADSFCVFLRGSVLTFIPVSNNVRLDKVRADVCEGFRVSLVCSLIAEGAWAKIE